MALTLKERKQELVRTTIWEAATDLFFEKGYDETTVDDIAIRAGISRRSCFRYFSSKSDLMSWGIVAYGDFIAEAVAVCPADSSLADVFRHVIVHVTRQAAVNPRTRRIIQISAKYPSAREAQHSRDAELHQRVEAALAPRCGSSTSPAMVAALLLSVLSVVFRVWFDQGEQDITATAQQVLSTLGSVVS